MPSREEETSLKINQKEVTVVRQRSAMSNGDNIFIPEMNFHCLAPAPTGKYKIIESPCEKCCNITHHFAIETKKGNRILSFGIKYLNLFCLKCGYAKQLTDYGDKNPWASLERMDLYRTTLDYVKTLDNDSRQKWADNLKDKYGLK